MLKYLCIALHLCSSLSGPARVIDGDTIIVEGVHVRLHGIDAEELSEPHGFAAKKYMRFLTGNSIITCKLTGERSFDRYIGYCFNSNADLGASMVAAGYALDCQHYSNGEYRKYEPNYIRSYLIQKPYC